MLKHCKYVPQNFIFKSAPQNFIFKSALCLSTLAIKALKVIRS